MAKLLALFLLNLSYFSFALIADYPELRQSVNPALDPCNDFYKFVCHGFHQKNKPKTECSEVSNTATRKAVVQKQLEDILKSRQMPPAGGSSIVQHLYSHIYAFHSSCKSWSNQLGSDVLLSKLEVLTEAGNYNRLFNTKWAENAFPIQAFFQLVSVIDTRKPRGNPERKIIGVRSKSLITSQEDWDTERQGGSLLTTRFGKIMSTLLYDDFVRANRPNGRSVLFPPSMDNLLKGDKASSSNGCTRGKCTISKQLQIMLNLEAERRVRNLFLVEKLLAQKSDPIYDNGPLSRQIYLRLNQLNSLPTPQFDLMRLFQTLLGQIGRQVNANTEVHLLEASFFQQLSWTISQLNSQQISDYLDWHVIWAFIPQMDRRYTLPYLKASNKIKASTVKKCPLEKHWMTKDEKCEKFIEWHFPQLLDRLYIQRHMMTGINDIRRIYGTVHAAFKKIIESNQWLDIATRGRALTKLATVKENAVYFDSIFNDALLEKQYAPYTKLRSDLSFALMVHQLEGASFLRQLATVDYYDPSWGVNAYYSRENNALVALNAYLQPPVYNSDFPQALNYAGIGTVLGHELSHGFDHWGSYYNADGQYEDWLGPIMRIEFHERKRCFAEQYGSIWVPADGTLLPINGTLTANENIADNSGLLSSFYAWQFLKRKARSTDSTVFLRLKGLEEFSEDQLFFMHYAFRQCSNMGQSWLRQRIITGQHSVVPVRVNVPLMNFPDFSSAFNCPIGSPMNPVKKCRIW